MVLKVRKIGRSHGVVLPPGLIEELGVKEGDLLFPIRTPDGVELVPYDPELAAVVESNRAYMRRHRNALAELAKR